MKSTIVLLISIISAIALLSLAFIFLRPEEQVTLPLQIEEYYDFNCGFCIQFHPTANQLIEDFGDQIVYEKIALPILGPTSEQAAFAAMAAENQGKYTEYVDILFENPEARTDEDYVRFAEELELDVDQFNADRENSDMQAELLARVEEDNNRGISSTPTLFINGRRVVERDYEALSQIIQEKIELSERQAQEENSDN